MGDPSGGIVVIAVIQPDIESVPGEAAGNGGTDTPASSGDQGDFTGSARLHDRCL